MQLKLKKISIMFLAMLLMVGSITAIMTSANLLVSQRFLSVWFSSFLFTFFVLLPTGGGVFIVLNKFINRWCCSWSGLQKNLLQAVLMAIVMESIMAAILIIKSGAYESSSHFLALFFNSLFYAFPIGLTLSLFMTVVIKPKLAEY
jgi:hypothetical protein